MEQKNNGKAIASLVLGIIGLVLSIFLGVYAWIGTVCAIVGLVLGVMAKKENPTGMATAGMVLSIIALAWGIIATIACYACASAFLNAAANAGIS